MVTIDEIDRWQSIHSICLTNLCLESPCMPLGYQQLLCELFDVPWNSKRGESTHPLALRKPLHVIILIV